MTAVSCVIYRFRKGKNMTERGKEQKIRMIAFDLDGTALHRSKGLTEFTKRTLEKAARSGKMIVAASGRVWAALPEKLTDMQEMEYFITGNGSSILYRKQGSQAVERIYGKDMEPDKVEAMLAVAADYPWPMEVFMDGAAYARADYVAHPTAFGASSDTYVRTTRKPVADIEDFVRRNISHIEGLNLIVADMEEKRVIRSRLEKIKDVYVTSSVPRYLEVSRGGVCKGTALQYLAKRLDISRDEILAFGDGENDIEMLQYAGIGVAMENGEKKLQAAADRIAPDCDEDGMAKTIQELIFDGENEL